MTFAEGARFGSRAAASALFSVLMYGLAVCIRLATLGRPGTRARLLVRATTLWGHGLARIWGMRIRVEGPRPRHPFFLVSNHISYADVVLICAVCPVWFVSKSEVASWPGIGALTRMGPTVFIDRNTRRDVTRTNALIGDLTANGGSVGFFPEATTTIGETVRPFKPGLFQAAVASHMPVTPAAIAYETPPGGPPPERLVAWVDDDEFLPHLRTLLGSPGFTARIRFGAEPVAADNRKDLARLAHDAVTALHRDLREASA